MDVLENVHDPLELIANMVAKVRLGGALAIYNYFYPLIECYLPCTFHLIRTFDEFRSILELGVVGKTSDNHATIYKKVVSPAPDWRVIRMLEAQSRLSYLMDYLRKANVDVSLFRYKIEPISDSPLYYPRKALAKLIDAFRRS